MRISNLAIVLSVAAGSALALPALTGAALAVQDQPVTIGGVETVCTGVGSAKDNPAWSGYPVKLVFANPERRGPGAGACRGDARRQARGGDRLRRALGADEAAGRRV